MELAGVLAQGSIVLLNKVPADFILGRGRGVVGGTLGGIGWNSGCGSELLLVVGVAVCCHNDGLMCLSQEDVDAGFEVRVGLAATSPSRISTPRVNIELEVGISKAEDARGRDCDLSTRSFQLCARVPKQGNDGEKKGSLDEENEPVYGRRGEGEG